MDVLDRPTPSSILLDEHIRLEILFFVDDECPSETLGVMILEDIQDLNKRTAHV